MICFAVFFNFPSYKQIINLPAWKKCLFKIQFKKKKVDGMFVAWAV